MQQSEAIELRKVWGKKHCNHPHFEKEYILGGDTGDYICTTCGKDFSREERLAIESAHEKEKDQ